MESVRNMESVRIKGLVRARSTNEAPVLPLSPGASGPVGWEVQQRGALYTPSPEPALPPEPKLGLTQDPTLIPVGV